MDANGAHVGAIKAILTEYPQAINLVVPQAEAIAAVALTVPDMFPKGSDQPPTNALPAVWEKPDEFKAAAQKVHDLAQKLADAAKGGDQQGGTRRFRRAGQGRLRRLPRGLQEAHELRTRACAARRRPSWVPSWRS